MVVRPVHVRVKACHAGAEIECLDLPELGEVVQRLVDGLERDRRHFGARRLVDDLGRGMRHVPLEDPEDALALRGDLAPTLAEQLAQLFGGAHADTLLPTIVN